MLAAQAVSVSENFDKTATSIKQYEHRMEQIAELKKHIINYAKTRDAYAAYRKTSPREKPRFRAAHEAELLLHSGQPMKRSCFCTKLLNGPLTSLEKRSCRR